MAEGLPQDRLADFDFGPPRPLMPLPGEPAGFERGYYQLERSERFATQQAISLHRPYAVMWYRLLDYYYLALDVHSVNSGDVIWLTKWKILRLGLTAAKVAIDATFAGYYVSAFGDIRQMAEYWFGIQYLDLNPESVAGFYAAPNGKPQTRLPYMGSRIKEVLAAYASDGPHADEYRDWFVQRINKTYKRMSDGHHLDGLAIVQTGAFEDLGYYLGATYYPSLAEEALYHGTLITGVLGMAAALIMEPINPGSSNLVAENNSAFGEALEQLKPLEESADGPEGGDRENPLG